MACGSGAGICGVKLRGRLPSLGVPSRHCCDLSLCKGLYRKEIYRRASLYIFREPSSSAGPREASGVMSKLVWEYQQAICAPSSQNKAMLLWVHGRDEIQETKDPDALAMEGSSS
jgi:hypothetical protein